jgi:hypothetical protein
MSINKMMIVLFLTNVTINVIIRQLGLHVVKMIKNVLMMGLLLLSVNDWLVISGFMDRERVRE